MAFRMARIPMTLNELVGHFCCYELPNASRGPSEIGELLVHNARSAADWRKIRNEPTETRSQVLRCV